MLTAGRGVPLSIAVAGANRHDAKLLIPTLDAIVIQRRDPELTPQHLCADAACKGQPCMEAMMERKYKPHVQQRGEEAAEKRANPAVRARRRVVERTHSWFNRWRKLLASFEKTKASYTGLLPLAAALMCWRKTITIYG